MRLQNIDKCGRGCGSGCVGVLYCFGGMSKIEGKEWPCNNVCIGEFVLEGKSLAKVYIICICTYIISIDIQIYIYTYIYIYIYTSG